MSFLFISCEKDYDLIAEMCTFDNPTSSCSRTDADHEHDLQKSDAKLEPFEVLNIQFASGKANLVFVFEMSHDLDETSLFYSGTELDNIIITLADGTKVMPEVEIKDSEMRISPLERLAPGVSYSVTLKKSIRNYRGQSLVKDQTYFPK